MSLGFRRKRVDEPADDKSAECRDDEEQPVLCRLNVDVSRDPVGARDRKQVVGDGGEKQIVEEINRRRKDNGPQAGDDPDDGSVKNPVAKTGAAEKALE